MKVLITTQPAIGHFHPLVPLAGALAAAGHTVAFATAPSFCPTIEAAGFHVFPAGLDWLESEAAQTFPELRTVPLEETAPLFINIFCTVTPRAMVPDLLALAARWRPDVIVREYWEFSGYLAGELLGIPHVTAGIGLFFPLDLLRPMIGRALDAVRQEFGLAPDPQLDHLFQDRYLHFLPPSYQPAALALPFAEAIRPVVYDRAGQAATLPAWVAALPPRPTVYATLGTVFNQTPGVFEAILAGLRDEPINLIITVGSNQDPARFGPQPEHIHIERFVPQSLLFPHCDLVITHGGYNTVIAALSAGLPMLILPLSADQPFHAQRCVELGAGISLAPAEITPEAIHDAVRELLANPLYRAGVDRLQQEIAALPGPEHAVALLADLAEVEALAA